MDARGIEDLFDSLRFVARSVHGAELDAHAQATVLEHQAQRADAREEQLDPVSVLELDHADHSDQTEVLEAPQPAIARDERKPAASTGLEGRSLALVDAHQDARRVPVECSPRQGEGVHTVSTRGGSRDGGQTRLEPSARRGGLFHRFILHGLCASLSIPRPAGLADEACLGIPRSPPEKWRGFTRSWTGGGMEPALTARGPGPRPSGTADPRGSRRPPCGPPRGA